jgi:hypothetical protein
MALLPAAYADLEPLARKWSLATESERAQRHLQARYAELETLYRTLLPRMPAILDDLNRTPIDTLDGAEKRLFWLVLSFVEAAVAVERFQCADMPPGAFEAERFQIGAMAT